MSSLSWREYDDNTLALRLDTVCSSVSRLICHIINLGSVASRLVYNMIVVDQAHPLTVL
jgi:hypothetical protein